MNNKSAPSLDTLISSLFSALPAGLSEATNDASQQLRAALKASLEKMNLVTREEFDVQKAVLARTRSKLEVLEKAVERLEEKGTPETTTDTSAKTEN